MEYYLNFSPCISYSATHHFLLFKAWSATHFPPCTRQCHPYFPLYRTRNVASTFPLFQTTLGGLLGGFWDHRAFFRSWRDSLPPCLSPRERPRCHPGCFPLTHLSNEKRARNFNKLLTIIDFPLPTLGFRSDWSAAILHSRRRFFCFFPLCL